MKAQSSVDTLLAVNEFHDPNTFVLIISNENYEREQSVPFALNDGVIFKLYCEKTLGIPPKNILYAPDATLNGMLIHLKWLQDVMKAYEGEARCIVYYSGHGMPSEDGKYAYLLPVDGISNMPSSGINIEEIYKQLGAMPSKATIVLLDACFSGARRDGGNLTSARALAIAVKEKPIKGNLVVFSAAQGNETAYPYKEKGHGLFTYYILKILQEKGGFVSLGELSDYVQKSVGRTSIVENHKSQSPSVIASTEIGDNWKKWMFTDKKALKHEVVKSAPPKILPTPTLNDIDIPIPKSKSIEFKVKDIVFNMIFVKGGSFNMGATEEQKGMANDKEFPVHQVTLSDYYIGETEVTQDLWEAVMGRNPSKFRGNHRPVECISWKNCQDFVDKLNEITGQKFRMPTEAEWEYAARGGHKGGKRLYSGSDLIDDVACYTNNCEERSRDVKSHQANELGLYDMSGNLWEWCVDGYSPYSSEPQKNPKAPDSANGRVIRGGSWFSEANDCRVSYRGAEPSTYKSSNIGFRLAK